MRDKDEYVRDEVEFELDTENPKEVKITIKSKKSMSGEDLYDALICLVHDILEPEIFGKGGKDCKDVRSH